MNLLEIYVTNITKHEVKESSYNGQTIRIHRLAVGTKHIRGDRCG